jgi:hypothetical protein
MRIMDADNENKDRHSLPAVSFVVVVFGQTQSAWERCTSSPPAWCFCTSMAKVAQAAYASKEETNQLGTLILSDHNREACACASEQTSRLTSSRQLPA